MAASSLNAVRARLHFDYPPPCMPDCRMSWVLVDLNKCRVVADLCSIIKEKFDYSRRTVLDLFIENCFLPPAESIYVVRDNDSIRVKVSSVSFEHAGEKRCRDDEGSFQAPTKRKKHDASEVNGVTPSVKKRKKRKAKKKKEEEQQMESGGISKAVVPGKASSSSKSQTNKKASASSSVVTDGKVVSSTTRNKSSASSGSSAEDPIPVKSKHKPAPGAASKQPAVRKTSSSDSSSEEENNVPLKKSSKPNTSLKTCPSTKTPKLQTSSVTPKSAPNSTTAKKTQTSSSSDLSSSEDDASAAARKAQVPGKSTNMAQTQPCSDSGATVENGATRTLSTPLGTKLQDNEDKAESSESSDTELVIKRPNRQVMAGLTPRGRARGFPDRVRGRGGVRGGFGRARGTPWKQNFHYNYDTDEQRKQKEIQTNKSLVLQNPSEVSPRRDYSNLPLLAAPPAVGQKIVFKLLELTDNYTPEVSDYKEGKIIGFNHSTNMIELELLTQSHARTEPGKFDLVYQDPDGSERVEYAVTIGSQLTERWESLLEPRLIVQDAD